MAILSTTPRFSDTGAGADADGSGSGSIDASRSYDIVTTADASEWEVLFMSPTPKRGYAHPDNPFLRVRNIRLERLSPIFWRYTADYVLEDSGVDSQDPNDPVGNPLLQPPVIRYGHEEVEEEIDEDEDGNPLVTVNGEPFARRTRMFGYRTITVERNVASFNPVEKDDYNFVTNSDTFLGYGPGRLLCKAIDAEPVTDGAFSYYKQTALIVSRTQGKMSSPDRAWWMRIRHEGFRVFVDWNVNGNPIFKHAELDGDKVSQPVMLDVDGRARADQSTAGWLEFKRYPSRSFAAANIL